MTLIMREVRLHANISYDNAVLAGASVYGDVIVPVHVADLTETQRRVLSTLPTISPRGDSERIPSLSKWDAPATDRLYLGRLTTADYPRGGEYDQHLSITIIGQRWVHATGRHNPPDVWPTAPKDQRAGEP